MSDDQYPAFDPAMADLHADRWTAPYWDAARDHRLSVARCTACGAFRMPPSPYCRDCRSQEIDWVDLPGTATLYAFTVARHALVPGAREAVPYVIGIVEPDGAPGVRIVTNVVGGDPDAVAIGLRLEVVYDDVTPDSTIPRFRPPA